MIKVYTDGGSRGNPGEAAIGVFITSSKGVPIASFGKRIGIGTNNEAEYTAVIEALNWIREHPDKLQGVDQASFFLDSLLVVSQITGLYKVKNPKMQSLLSLVRIHERAITIPISYQHIPRVQNSEADRQVNMALDNLAR